MIENPDMETSGRSVTVAALQIDLMMAVSLQTQHLASWHRLTKATQIRKDHKVTCIRVHAEVGVIDVADFDLSKRQVRQVLMHR